jgi:hypothetical protein
VVGTCVNSTCTWEVHFIRMQCHDAYNPTDRFSIYVEGEGGYYDMETVCSYDGVRTGEDRTIDCRYRITGPTRFRLYHHTNMLTIDPADWTDPDETRSYTFSGEEGSSITNDWRYTVWYHLEE